MRKAESSVNLEMSSGHSVCYMKLRRDHGVRRRVFHERSVTINVRSYICICSQMFPICEK